MSIIHYAISIDSGKYDESMSEVGLRNGFFRFVTDNYNPNGILDEVGRTVDGTWYDEFLIQESIGKAGQRIDIVNGGAYSNLNGFEFSIVNQNRFSTETYIHDLDTLVETYIIGSKISLYIIVNDVMYDRWNGIVSGYSLSDNGAIITFKCDDESISDYKLMPPLVTEGADTIGVVIGDSKYNKVSVSQAVTTVATRYDGLEFKPNVVLRVTPNSPQNLGYTLTTERGFTQYPDPDVDPLGIQDAGLVDVMVVGANPPLAFKNNGFDASLTAHSGSNYVSGYSYILIFKNLADKITGNNLVGRYKGKYIVFSDDAVYNNAKDIVSDDSVLYEITNSMQWGDYTHLFTKEVPDWLVDRTQMFGEHLPTDNDILGELIPDTIKSFIIVEKETKVILSNTAIKEITEPDLNTKIHFAPGATIAYIKGEISPVIKIGLKISEDASGNENLSYIVLDPNKVIGNVIDSYMSVYPTGIINYKNMIPDVGYVDNGHSGYMSPSDNVDNTNFTEIAIGLGELLYTHQYPQTELTYKKCNITIPFDVNLFNPEDYDSVYLNLLLKKSFTNARVIGGGSPFDNIYLSEPPQYPIQTTSGEISYSTSNPKALRYQVEIRAAIETTAGIRHTQNYNDIDVGYIVNAPIVTPVATIPPGETEYYRTVRSPFLICMPQDFANYEYFQEYVLTWPRQMGYKVSYQNDVEVNLVNEYHIDCKKGFEIDKDLFRIINENGMYTITCTISPVFYAAAGDAYTWDKIEFYTPSLLLRKEIDLSEDIYLRMKGELQGTSETNTLPTALLRVVLGYVTSSVGIGNISTTRATWYTGRQITEQQNSLNYVKELCEQSFIVGWRSRSTVAGRYQFKSFLEEDTENAVLHDKSIITRGSIKGLALTPLVKVYNEISVKYDYNAITGKFDKAYSINNVSNEQFPVSTVETQIRFYHGFVTGNVINLDINGVAVATTTFTTDTETTEELLRANIQAHVDVSECNLLLNGTIQQAISIDNFTSLEVTNISVTGGATQTSHDVAQVFDDSDTALWRQYVQGINSYSDAKQVWIVAHANYLKTKVVNKLPDKYAELDWASDRNSFNDTDTFDATEEYAWNFFKLANEWNTKQKFVVKYQLPITADTVKLEIMQLVTFNDIVATGGLDAIGWIYDFSLDAKKGLFNVKLIFTLPDDITCGTIIEAPTNTDDIEELQTNIDDIDEDCPLL